MSDIHVLMPVPLPRLIVETLGANFRLHKLWLAPDQDAMVNAVASDVRAIATGVNILAEGIHFPVDAAFMARLPKLEIVANLGVGYDNIDAKWAAAHNIAITNTPDVLTEETADTAFGLLLNAVRQFSAAERYLRAGKWQERAFPLTASLRGRKLGIIGLGRIGKAIARRAEGFGLEIAYHSRRKADGVPYQYVPSLMGLAEACDILMVVVPGGPETKNMINAEVLKALGPDGILINIARGTVVDEAALADALRNKTILTAGLDVFANEPNVPAELIAMDHVVLLPHVGSGSHVTRDAMGQLVIDNLLAWRDGRPLLTPVS